MNKLLLFILFGASVCAIMACKQTKTAEPVQDNYKKLYAMARQNNDYEVMATSIYNILLADSTAKGWNDSLIKNLYDRGLYERSHVLASRRISKEPNNRILLMSEGMYARTSGKADEALAAYRKLYALTSEPSDGYLLAGIYFALQKVDSCDAIANKIIAGSNLDSKFIEVESGYTGQTQRVPARAVLLNLKGVLARAKGDNKTAVTLIGQALQIFPDFMLAQQQMQALQGGGQKQ